MAYDSERDEWLAHLRKWGERLAKHKHPAHGTNWQRLNISALETAAVATPGCLTRWWNRTLRGAGQNEARISREDYLKLCPWLAAWYGYEPPTREWKFS
ncbi:hypothetical protein [Hymenobacter cheonanensis]|uniref:hypothetical protein n=1 Tax=Hymenobacter sp. CA2-7 TaxID=3063993 RepID=UPI0027123816|nr:hypothetical protein [Hymenobacter sp. CA2-7]MDO7885363.1 hypothetical protein [Hymenobacter sp. CA2-7]